MIFGVVHMISRLAALDALMKEYGIDDRYAKRLVSICCDGTSINMGKYHGVTTQLQRTRLWLLIIHCVNHRLELAIKDASREDSSFTEVSDVLLGLYLCTRNSGKVKALLKKIVLDLDVMCVAFVKPRGLDSKTTNTGPSQRLLSITCPCPC